MIKGDTIMYKMRIVFNFLFFTLIFYSTNFSQDAIDITGTSSERFNERGFVSSASFSTEGNEIITDYDGNYFFNYNIPIELPDGLSGSVSMIFNSNTEHHVFFHPRKIIKEEPGLDVSSLHGFAVNKGEWILGFNGFALHTFLYDANIYAHNRNFDQYFLNLQGNEVPLLISGINFCNMFNDTNSENNILAPRLTGINGKRKRVEYYRDQIVILKADGSKVILFNEFKGMGQGEKEYTGKYISFGPDAHGYAIVKLQDAPNYHNLRDIYYHPGDGNVYHFIEKELEYQEFYFGGYGGSNNDNAFDMKFLIPRGLVLNEIISANGVKLVFNYGKLNDYITNINYGRSRLAPKSIDIVASKYPDATDTDIYPQVPIVKFEGNYVNTLKIVDCLKSKNTSFYLSPVDKYATPYSTQRLTNGSKQWLVTHIIDNIGRETYIQYGNQKRMYHRGIKPPTGMFTLVTNEMVDGSFSFSINSPVISEVDYPNGKKSIIDYYEPGNSIFYFQWNEISQRRDIRNIGANIQVKNNKIKYGNTIITEKTYSFPQYFNNHQERTQENILTEITDRRLISNIDNQQVYKKKYIEKSFTKYLLNHKIGYTSDYSRTIKLTKEQITYDDIDEKQTTYFTYDADLVEDSSLDPFFKMFFPRKAKGYLTKKIVEISKGDNVISNEYSIIKNDVNICGLPDDNEVCFQGSYDITDVTVTETGKGIVTETTFFVEQINAALPPNYDYNPDERFISGRVKSKIIKNDNLISYKLDNTINNNTSNFGLINKKTEFKDAAKTVSMYEYCDISNLLEEQFPYYLYTGLLKKTTINNSSSIEYFYPTPRKSVNDLYKTYQTYSFEGNKIRADGNIEILNFSVDEEDDLTIFKPYKTEIVDLKSNNLFITNSGYNKYGQIQYEVDVNNYITEYTFDAVNRLIAAAFPMDFSDNSTNLTTELSDKKFKYLPNHNYTATEPGIQTEDMVRSYRPNFIFELTSNDLIEYDYEHLEYLQITFEEEFNVAILPNLSLDKSKALLKIKCKESSVYGRHKSGTENEFQVYAITEENGEYVVLNTNIYGTGKFVENSIVEVDLTSILKWLIPQEHVSIAGFRIRADIDVQSDFNPYSPYNHVALKNFSFDHTFKPVMIISSPKVVTHTVNDDVSYLYKYSDFDNSLTIEESMDYSSTNHKKKINKYSYDCFGNILATTRYSANGTQHTLNTNEYNFAGELSHSVDAEGRNVYNHYDAMGRSTQTKFVSNNETAPTVNMSYMLDTENNEVVSKKIITDEIGNVTEEVSDKYGNKIRVAKYHENDPDDYTETKFEYDDINRLTKVISDDGLATEYQYYDETGLLKKKKSSEYYPIEYKYNQYGQLIMTLQQTGGDNTIIGDEVYEMHYNHYDGFGRILQKGIINGNKKYFTTLDPDSPTLSGSFPSSTVGQISGSAIDYQLVGDTSKLVVVNAYDGIKTDGVFSNATFLGVHKNNLKGKLALTAFRDKPGQPWSYKYYSYDERGNIESYYISYQGGTKYLVEYEYDKLGNVLKETVNRFQLYKWYDYDEFGRLTKIQSSLSNNKSTAVTDMVYTYNNVDQINTANYLGINKDIFSTQYTYNNRGFLSNLNTFQRDNGVGETVFSQNLNYYKNGNIYQNESFNSYLGQSIEPLLTYSYSYDYNNQLTFAEDRVSGFECIYRYVAPGKLASINRNGTQIEFEYRDNSNGYNPSNKLLNIWVNGNNGGDNVHYSYKGMMSKNPQSGISIENRNYLDLPLKLSKDQTNIAYYHYDETGTRLFKDDGTNKEFYFNDPSGKNVAIYDYTDKSIKLFNLFGNGNEGRIEVNYVENTIVDPETGKPEIITTREYERFYYLKDHLGTIRATIAEDGSCLSAQDYYPFGSFIEGRVVDNSDNLGKIKFTGKERDKESGLDYFGARYYDSKYVLWMSVDPMASSRPGLSPYNYCQNNPIARIDPTGMLDGDYYDQNGTKLGDDGIDDGKVYVANNGQTSNVQQNLTNGNYTAAQQGSTLLVGQAARATMVNQAQNVTAPDYETGGSVTTTTQGKHRALPAVDGARVTTGRQNAYINVYAMSPNANLNGIKGDVVTTYHSHPVGTSQISFNQPPSDFIDKNGKPAGDIPNARTNPPVTAGYHQVLSVKNNRVYIYNGSGVITSFPMNKFKTLGK